MIDCPNVEMRDRLPDLANETLEPAVRALVLVHLTECPACTAEVEILRTTRLILVAATPRVNVAGIASALPHYGVTNITTARSARRRGLAASWRAAAALTFLAAGLGSYALVKDRGVSGDPSGPVAAASDSSVGMALTGALADMSDAELTALVSDIESIEALPSTEVETMGNPVELSTILPDSVVRDLEVR